MLSYNQIIRRIKNLAISHLQIDSFYQGDPHEFDEQSDNQTAENVAYAACFVETLPGSINRADKVRVYNFKVTLLDRVELGKENEQEVQSDMDLVAQDFVAMLGNPYYRDWELTNVSPVTFVTEMLNDMCAGVELDITINVDYVPDVCQIPRDAILTEDGFNIVTEQQQTFIQE